MSELCEICGRDLTAESHAARDRECLSDGFAREQARADRSEAEFYACKALLMAAQKRAERAEAERSEARARSDRHFEWYEHQRQLADKARAALREALFAMQEGASGAWNNTEAILRTALAALPVEPARPQVTENANALGAPARGCSEEER